MMMEKENIKVVIIGTGVSGLATAWLLEKEGFYVQLFDKNPVAGGVTNTKYQDGYVMDFGPNSALETTPLIAEIADSIGMKEDMIHASTTSDKRYILKNGELHALPMKPHEFLGTKLFSFGAKLRVFGELFIGRSKDGYYQSIADFVKRRLGKQFLDYAIDPFVSGVYAGDPHKLSVKSAFPKLYRLEEKYGGIFKGVIRGRKERKKSKEKSKSHAKMFSFKQGMRSFALKLSDSFKAKVNHDTLITNVEASDGRFTITTDKEKTFVADIVISTSGAFAAASYLKNMSETLPEHLNAIHYPQVLVLNVRYKKADIKRPLDGFGYLIPSKEKKSYLGAIWSSVLFENRAPEDEALFTIFVGGAKHPDMLKEDNTELVNKVLAEFEENMKITGKHIYKLTKHWKKAIPQYNLGHIEHEKAFEEFEKNYPGLFLGGNYRGGIAFGDCFKSAERISEQVTEYVKKL